MWSPQRPRCSCGCSSEWSDRSLPQMGRCPSNCRGRVGEGKSWQGLEAEVKVKRNACGKGPGTIGGLGMWGHQRLGKSGQEARVFIFLSCSHLRSSSRYRGSVLWELLVACASLLQCGFPMRRCIPLLVHVLGLLGPGSSLPK